MAQTCLQRRWELLPTNILSPQEKVNLFYINLSVAQVVTEKAFLNLVIKVAMLSGNYCL